MCTIELYFKYPKLGPSGPSFAKTGDEVRSQGENSTHWEREGGAIKEHRTELVSSPKLVLNGVSPPVLDLPYLCLIFFMKSCDSE
jgi:hypothetical protein